MPQTLTGSPSYDSVSIPLGAEPRTIASLQPAFQALTNHGSFFKNIVDTGVTKIRTFSSPTDLQNFASPVDGQHAYVTAVGVFQYIATSTATTASFFVVQPTSVSGPGRWVNVFYSVVGLPSGIAKLDSSGAVPASQLGHAALLDTDGKIEASQTRGSAIATNSYSRTFSQSGSIASTGVYQRFYGDGILTNDGVALASLVIGDLVHVHVTTEVASLTGDVITLGLRAEPPSSTFSYLVGGEHSVTAVNTGSCSVSMCGFFYASEAGNHGFSVFIKGVSGQSYNSTRTLLRAVRLSGV